MSRYVLLYRDFRDPPPAEERELLSSLRNVTVIDRVPGTVLVDGLESDLAQAVSSMPNWRYAPAASVEVNPPVPRIEHPL